jgi:tetratricopeptide (TPR) repeat protein/DNA-binding response OmpR family regulator
MPHARARGSVPPKGRILGAPIAPLTGALPPDDVIPKPPALPTIGFGALPKAGTTNPFAAFATKGAGAKAAAPLATAPKAAGPLAAAPLAAAPKAKAQPLAAASAPTASDGLDPTVLLVGAGEKFTPAFQAALARHRVFVEVANPDAVLEAVVTAAPDLVLLMGEAALDCGSDLLTKLAALPQNFSVPVVILEDATELDSKLRAFRSGATAIIPRSASVDATAEQVARLARQIPEQGTDTVGMLGEATLEDFVSALSKQLRSELVSVVGSEGQDGEAVRLVLGQGRPLAEFMDLFVRRVRRHVLLAEPLRYELDDRLGSGASGESARPRGEPLSITNLRVILADDDTPRADSVARELRTRGATVIVTDLDPSDARFERLRQVDPTVLMIGESHVHGAGHSLLRRMRQDTRLRWASQLVVRWEEVWSDRTGELGIQRFESTLAGLAEPEAALRGRADVKAPFDTRLETMGPARSLRALAACGHSLRVSVQNPRAEVTVDLSDGLIVGAAGRALGDHPKELEGANALAALLLLGSGRVHVEAVDQPATANVMAPVDVALNMADAEAPPIAPSIPVAGALSIHPPFQGAPLGELLRETVPPIPVPTVRIQPPAGPAPRVALLPAPEATPAQGTLVSVHPSPVVAASVSEPSPQALEAPSALPPPVEPAPAPAPAELRREPAGVPVAKPAPANAWQSLLARARSWYTAQNAQFHAKRLSFSTAGLLLALGILQGVGLVVVYAGARAFGGHPATEDARPVAAPAPKPAPVALATPTPSAAPAPPPVAAPLPREPDGSGRRVEDCKTLLAPNPPQDGYYPGASQEQSRLGRAAIVRGDLKEARRSYCRAVHWNPRNLDIVLQLAQVLLLERDGARALEYAERAAAIDPNPTRVQEVLGDAYARVGAYEDARRAWFAAASLDPTSDEATRLLLSREVRQADQALRQRNLVIAEKFFRRAAILEPASTSSMVGLSYVLTQLEDMQGAAFWARRAVRLAPRSAAARLALGDALHAAKDTRAAVVEWREASLLDPNNNEAVRRLRRAGAATR